MWIGTTLSTTNIKAELIKAINDIYHLGTMRH